MRIWLIYRRLAIGGGDFWPSSFCRFRASALRRNALTFTIFAFIAVLVMAPVLASCSKGDELVRTDDSVTRALTHADSVRLGLVIELKADSAWDGEIDVEF